MGDPIHSSVGIGNDWCKRRRGKDRRISSSYFKAPFLPYSDKEKARQGIGKKRQGMVTLLRWEKKDSIFRVCSPQKGNRLLSIGALFILNNFLKKPANFYGVDVDRFDTVQVHVQKNVCVFSPRE